MDPIRPFRRSGHNLFDSHQLASRAQFDLQQPLISVVHLVPSHLHSLTQGYSGACPLLTYLIVRLIDGLEHELDDLAIDALSLEACGRAIEHVL